MAEAPAPEAARTRQDQAARWFLCSAVFWLVIPGLAGLFMAFFLFFPVISDHIPMALRPYLQFGRLRPMHVNLAIFGWLSMVYAGSMLFIVPRLTRAPLFSDKLAWVNLGTVERHHAWRAGDPADGA